MILKEPIILNSKVKSSLLELYDCTISTCEVHGERILKARIPPMEMILEITLKLVLTFDLKNTVVSKIFHFNIMGGDFQAIIYQ
jgi:hypothetical protein